MSRHQIHIRENPVPGVGRSYEMPIEGGHSLSFGIDARTGDRTLSVLRAGEDEPAMVLHLDEAEALILATFMGGVRIEVEGAAPRSAVQVDTVVIGAGSPACGRSMAQLQDETAPHQPHPDDARIIAVIRDDTPDLVEADPARASQPGDRLVLAGRPGDLDELRRWLAG